MRLHPQGWLFVALLAFIAVCSSAGAQSYVPTPIIEVGKPPLRDIAYSPDGETVATVTEDWIEILDATTYEPVARFGRGGTDVEFSPDRSEVAVLGYGKPWAIYDVESGAVVDESPLAQVASAISPDWRRVAYAEGDIVYVWDRDAQAVTVTLSGDPEPFMDTAPNDRGTSSSVSAQRVKHLTFHPDGVRLLVSSYRTTLAVWDTFAGEVLRHYRFDGWTDGVAVRPDGSEFAVHTHGGRALRWGFGDVEPRPLSVLPRPGSASTLEYDPGGRHLWSIGPDFALHGLDLGDDTDAVATVPVANASVTLSFYRASVRPTHNQVASLTGGRIAIWSADSLELDRIVDHAWGAGSAPFVSYAPGRGTLTLFGQVTRTWSVPDGRLIHTYEFPEFLQHVALSNSGERAIAQVADEVQVFDTTTGEVLLALDQAPYGPRRYALSPSGRSAAVWDATHTTVWDVATGEPVATVSVGSRDFERLTFTLDDRSLVVLQRIRFETLRVWDIQTDTLLTDVQGGAAYVPTERGIFQAVWPRDGSTGGPLEVRLAGMDEPLSVIQPPERASRADVWNFLEFDPSARYVMLRHEDPGTHHLTRHIYSADTGALLGTYPPWPEIRFAGSGDYILAEGPTGGRALYRTEEFLNIVPTDVAARGKLLTAWGDVKRTRLLPNYPNPFNPETWIPFDLAEAGPVEVVVYDGIGRVVRRVDLGYMPAGAYRSRERAAFWDGRNDAGETVASGAYFVELSAGGRRRVQRTTLAK